MTWFVLVYGPGQRALVREVHDRVTVGRVRGNDLVIPLDTMSRRHCEIFQRDELLWIRDSRSASGTYVNGRKFRGDMQLHVGDRIVCGDARMIVDDRFPEAWVSHELLEWSAPVGARFSAGDHAHSVDFAMPRDRMQQGRAYVDVQREGDAYRVVGGLDHSTPSDRLHDGDAIRIGDRGLLHFHLGRPADEPVHSFFRDSGLASLAQMLVAKDVATREQATHLLRALGTTEETRTLLEHVRVSAPLGRAMSHLQRPPRIQVHDEHLAGPMRSAFEHLALHALAQSDEHDALRASVTSLWVGFVAPPPWWEREQFVRDEVRLDVDLEPLAAFERLEALVVENAARVFGPPLPTVGSVQFIGCRGLGDYRSKFPGVARWDAHQPRGFSRTG